MAGTIEYASYLTSAQTTYEYVEIYNNNLYLAGITENINFPAVGGGMPYNPAKGKGVNVYTRIDATNTIVYSTVIQYNNNSANIGTIRNCFGKVVAGEFYIVRFIGGPLASTIGTHNGGSDIGLIKYNSDNTLAYISVFGGNQHDEPYTFAIENGMVYIGGQTRSSDFPVTNGSVFNSEDAFVARLDASTGIINFATYLGGSTNQDYVSSITVSKGFFGVAMPTGSSDISLIGEGVNYPFKGSQDVYTTVFSPTGTQVYGGYYGGTDWDGGASIASYNGCFYTSFLSSYSDFQTTDGSTAPGESDFGVFNLSISPAYLANTISPSTQSPCLNGYVENLSGNIVKSADGLYLAEYQWQVATNLAGPWADIAGATLKNYQPTTDAATKYYRRLAINTYCEKDTISISNISTVNAATSIAPVLDAGGVFYVCSGQPVTIGGSPTATGGVPSYTYAWDMAGSLNNAAIANPVATVTQQTIFTLTVTDAQSCKAIDQAVVLIPVANAGADKSSCGGSPVQIGAAAYPTSSGITYAWSPTTELSCTTCAQPTVIGLSSSRNYILTVTVPIEGGGTCTLMDTVFVNLVASPGTGYAGTDKIVCYGDSVVLGTPTMPGYTYLWGPGANISSNSVAQPTFYANAFTVPNPTTYYCTLSKDNCLFYDDVSVTVMEGGVFGGMAGIDGCGPRGVGVLERTPSISESYTWEKVSGDGNILGATNVKLTTVSATTAGQSVYKLTSTYMGHTCMDSVIVPTCGCIISIETEDGNCAMGIGTKLIASANTVGTFTWTPAVGLNTYIGSTVVLTDNVARTYTVSFVSSIDPSFTCSASISVNGAWAYPGFQALDTIVCPNSTLNIGQTFTNPDYTYTWSPASGLSCSNCSNPSTTVAASTNYYVKVTDNTTGCFILDTARISVRNVVADAGVDFSTCSNNTVTLGTSDLSGGVFTYTWSPPASPWQNGTDQNDAQPDVLVATSLDFTLLVTDPISGCTDRDTISITVSGSAPTAMPGSDKSLCEDALVGVQIGTPAVPGVEYLWSPATGLSCTDCAQPTALPTATQIYTLTVKYEGACALTNSANVTVTVNPKPTINLGADLTSCPSTPLSVGANAPAGMTTYSWTPAAYLSSTSIANPSTVSPAEITYTLEVTNSNGCKNTDDIKITPSSSVNAGADKVMCMGTDATIGHANNAASASWSPATGLSCTTCAQPIFTPTSAGTFTFTVTQTIAGCTTTDQVVITVNQEASPVIPIPPVACQNSCVQIGITPQIGKSYAWSPATGLSDYQIANPIACVTTSNQGYTLNVTNMLTGCSSSATVTVGVAPTPAPALSANDVTMCTSSSEAIDLSVTGGSGSYSYLWSPAAGLSSITIEDPIALGNPVGTRTHTVTVTDMTSGCTSQKTVQITVKNCITISGKVWNDHTGTDITKTEDEMTLNLGGTLFAYLIDPITGLVIDKVQIASNGTYMFTGTVNTSYQIVLSDEIIALGAAAPAPHLPTDWLNTGENKDGVAETTTLGLISLTTGNVNVINQDFGIEQLPNSVDYSYTIPQPANFSNAGLLTDNGMSPISGSDPEDGAKGWGSTFKITDLSDMNGNTLWYDANGDGIMNAGEELTVGEEIKNYDPNKLMVGFTGVGSTSFTFHYTTQDNAGRFDPSPAIYIVNWAAPLPIELLSFGVKASAQQTAILNWVTVSEIENSHFNVQHLNGLGQWEIIGVVKGHGTTTETNRYTLEHKNPMQGNNYYRLEIVSTTGKVHYSNIVSARFKNIATETAKVYPNPTTNVLNIHIGEVAKNNSFIRVIDMNGRLVSETTISEGQNSTVINTENWVAGIYTVLIISTDRNETIKVVKE
jgi:hypothetical protein